MAIIIPSKNIYEKNNPKIRNNFFDKAEYTANRPSVSLDVETFLYGEDVLLSHENLIEEKYEGGGNAFNDVTSKYLYTVAQYNKGIIKVPKEGKNSSIKKVDKVSFSLVGKREAYDISAWVLVFQLENGDFWYRREYIKQNSRKDFFEGTLDFSFMPTNFSNYHGVSDNSYAKVIREDNRNYYIEYYLLTKYFEDKLESTGEDIQGLTNTNYVGTRKYYEANTANISLNGNMLVLRFEETQNTITSKQNAQKPLSLEANELIQTTNYADFGNGRIDLLKFNYENTLKQYKNGKETATIMCDINEYKDDTGNLVISTKSNDLPMTFSQGDIVIPMVLSANNKDQPMSKYKDMTAKKFEVAGVEIIYDGALFQRLTLQEYTE